MEKEFEEYCREGAFPHIIINKAEYLSLSQFLRILKSIREDIERGSPLTSEDSNEIGNKYSCCSWGMCSDNAKHFPDPAMHSFPRAFRDRERITVLNRPKGFDCPMRDGGNTYGQGFGCFWQCRVFQRNRKTPSREEALILYDDMIRKIEEKISGEMK